MRSIPSVFCQSEERRLYQPAVFPPQTEKNAETIYRRKKSLFAVLNIVLVLFNHLLDHLATDGAGLLGGRRCSPGSWLRQLRWQLPS